MFQELSAQGLSHQAITLFKLLCALGQPVTGSTLRDCYLRLSLTPEEVKATRVQVQELYPAINELIRRGLMSNCSPRYQIIPELHGRALIALKASGELKAITAAVKPDIIYKQAYYRSRRVHDDVPSARLHLLSGELSLPSLDELNQNTHEMQVQAQALQELLAPPYDQGWANSFTPQLRAWALERGEQPLKLSEPTLIDALTQLYTAHALTPTLALNLARLSALGHPQAPALRDLKASCDEPSFALVELWAELLRGGLTRALIERFFEALAVWQKANKARSRLPNTPEVLWLLLGACELSPHVSLSPFQSPIQSLKRKKEASQAERDLLGLIAQRACGEPTEVRFKLYDDPNDPQEALPLAFALKALSFTHMKKVSTPKKAFTAALKSLDGLGWRALSLTLIESSEGFSLNKCALPSEEAEELKERARELRAALGLSVKEPAQAIELWRWQLQNLANFSEEPQEAPDTFKGPKDERLVWELTLSGAHFELTARHQLLRAGAWTKGRVISLKRLYEEHQQLPFLTSQDHAICDELHVRYTTYSWRTEREYHFSPEALFKLIDHPHVYQGRGQRLLITEGYAEAQVKALKKGGWKLSLSPQGLEESSYSLVDHHLTLYRLTVKQRLLLSLQREPIKVPPEGTEELKALLNKLSPHFTLHSALSLDAPTDAHPKDASKAQDKTSKRAAQDTQERAQERLVRREALKPMMVLRLRREGERLVASQPRLDCPEGLSLEAGEGAREVTVRSHELDLVYERELKAERELLSRLMTCLSEHATPEGADWRCSDLSESLALLEALHELKEEVSVEWPEGDPLRFTPLPSKRLSFMVSADQSAWFEVQGELKLNEDHVLSLSELLRGFRAGQGRFIKLKDDELLTLEEEVRAQLSQLDALLVERAGEVVSAHTTLTGPLLAVLKTLSGEEVKAPKKWLKRAARFEAAMSKNRYTPRGFEATFRPYQKEGFQWLSRLMDVGFGACLADDMGLGKTLQLIALLCQRRASGPSLVIAPTSLLSHWVSELTRFSNLTPKLLNSATDRLEMIKGVGAQEVLITSYGLLVQEEEALTSRSWNVITFDEAQALKNPTTKRSQAARALKGEGLVALSGTPIENHLIELWSLFHVLNPGLLGSYQGFKERFQGPIERGGAEGERAQEALKALTQPFLLRRRKRDVLQDLPPKSEQTLLVPLSELEASLYEALRRGALQELEEAQQAGRALSHVDVFARLTRLRLAACHVELVRSHFKETQALTSELESLEWSAKQRVLRGLLKELKRSGHRALIFSQFVKHLNLLKGLLESEQLSYHYLDGSTPAQERAVRVEAFQAGEGDVFLMSLKAGGVGLNLTGADYVIHMDPWWNPAVEDQASDRAHRIGQERPVMVYRFIAEGTVEEKILSLHEQKRSLAEQLLEGSESIQTLNLTELMELL